MSGLVSRGWHHVRRHGVTAIRRRVFERFVYRSQQFVIYRTHLAGPPAPAHVADIVFRLATPSDLQQLNEFGERAVIHRNAVEQYKDRLFVASDGGRIVATRRYSRRLPEGPVSRVLTLGPRDIWSADAFCLPEYRNRGINRHFGFFTIRFLAAQGYADEFGEIVASNFASLKSVRNRGGEFVYFVSFSRVLSHERLRVSTELPKRIDALLTR